MRTEFVESAHTKSEFSGSSDVTGHFKPNVVCAQDLVESAETKYVQLEIRVDVLLRLISQRRLVVEELHCLNKLSKRIIRSTILNSLTNPVKPSVSK